MYEAELSVGPVLEWIISRITINRLLLSFAHSFFLIPNRFCCRLFIYLTVVEKCSISIALFKRRSTKTPPHGGFFGGGVISGLYSSCRSF